MKTQTDVLTAIADRCAGIPAGSPCVIFAAAILQMAKSGLDAPPGVVGVDPHSAALAAGFKFEPIIIGSPRLYMGTPEALDRLMAPAPVPSVILDAARGYLKLHEAGETPFLPNLSAGLQAALAAYDPPLPPPTLEEALEVLRGVAATGIETPAVVALLARVRP